MYNRKSLAAALVLACAAGAGIVIACGPDFPPQLLDDRAGTLQGTPANSFAYEAARLMPATDTLRANESPLLPDGSYRSDAIPEAFDTALTPAQREQARTMRARPVGDQANAAGAGLPEAARLYAAAAVDYRSAAQAPVPPAPSSTMPSASAAASSRLSNPVNRSAWVSFQTRRSASTRERSPSRSCATSCARARKP